MISTIHCRCHGHFGQDRHRDQRPKPPVYAIPGQAHLIRYGRRSKRHYRAGAATQGFTLVEVIFSILLLGIMVTSITGVYFVSLGTLNAQENLLPLDSRLRGRMEEIISRPFDAIVGGSDSVNINGQNHTITWTVTQPDLDGDAIPESMAKRVTVTTGDRSLTTLVIDSQAAVGKI